MDVDAVIREFLDAMRSRGVNMDTAARNGASHPITDGKLHRADALGKKNKKNQHIWYVLHPDAPASGAFGDLQLGIEDTWTAGGDIKKLTKEEKAELAKRMEETRRQREADQAALNAAAAAAAALIMKAAVKAVPSHAYLAKKGLPVFPGLRMLTVDVPYVIEPGEEPQRVARKGNLVVPIYSPDKALVSVQLIRADGSKSFLKGTAKAGNYHSIGKAPEDPAKFDGYIYIGEGYATVARIHQATGGLCFAAFDAGNLEPVAINLRKKFKRAKFVFCADNDRFVKAADGTENPGVTKARSAAERLKGIVAIPQFADDETKATDFDDLAQLNGLDRVRETIEAAINPPRQEAPPADQQEFVPDNDPGAVHPLASFGYPHFRCLGVDGTTCFYQPADVSQVISLAASAHKLENLILLAPLQWWEMEFPAKKEGVDVKAAVNACIRACKYRRKFLPHKTLRGRGAWFEGELPVFHAGDHLIVDCKRVPIAEHDSRFVYDEGYGIPIDIEKPAETQESRRFLELCKSLRWQNKLSGYLLAGWCVVAPVCGFLKWRPHLWINGAAGSGKSTVMDRIVKVCIESTALSVVGNTSEAGIRGTLGMDALPIIFDEAEPRDFESKQRIKAILDLSRVASSESDGLILKGTSNQSSKGYRARSMFVFASINTQIEGYADETRFTQLTLALPAEDADAEESKAHYERLLLDIVTVMTPAFARRLLARTIHLLPVLRQLVAAFTDAARIHLKSQRLGDQIGPMLAGAYLLNSTKEITAEEALAWIRKSDWADHSAKNATKDNERFLQHVTGYLVRHDTPEGGRWERTIGELIELAAYADDHVTDQVNMTRHTNKQKNSAISALARLGVRVYAGGGSYLVDITTSYEGFRHRVLRNTEWSGTRYRDILKAIPGAVASKGNRYFASGINTPYVSVPIEALLKERIPGEDDE